MKRHGDGRRVKIDSRFKEMLTSDNFKVTYSVDSRGRPLAKKSESGVDIEKYYHLSDSDDDGNDIHGSNDGDASEIVPTIKKLKRDDVVKKSPKKIKTLSPKKPNIKNNDDIDDEDDDDDDDSSDDDDKAHSNKPINADDDDDEDDDDDDSDSSSSSSSSSSPDDDDDDNNDDSISHPWGEIDREASVMENPTRRLAVCNMDWDRIKSVDLMVLFSSFKPEGGIIKSISIYPSDFGLERMKEEEWKGPKELTEKSDKVKLLDEASSEKYFKEKLRLYQLNRLKYFYAVLECDSVSTADAIYSNCNAMEYERSSTVLDLRFIPDDMTFDDRDPTSVCTSLPPKGSYKPTIFVNTALHQSNVQLTWDETPQERQAVLMADFTKKELRDDEIKHYLASSSDEETAATDDDDDDDGASDENGGCEDGDATAATTAAAPDGDDDDDGAGDDDFFIASSKREGSQCDEVNNKAKGKDGKNNNNNNNNNKNKNNIEGESNGRKNKLNSNVDLYVSLLNELNDGKPNSRRKDGDDDDDDDVHMEVTWEPGLKEAAEVMVKENQKSKLTNWEQYLEKRREKRKLRKKFKREATRKQKNDDDDEDDNITKDSKNKQRKSRDKKLKRKNQPVKERELTESEKADLELLMMDVDGDDDDDVSRNGDDPKIRSKKKLKKMKKMKEDQATEVSDSRFSKIHSDPKFSDKAEKKKKEKPKY